MIHILVTVCLHLLMFANLMALALHWRFSLNASLIGLIMIWGLVAAPALAQGGYPQPYDSYVNDYAEALTDQDVGHLQTMLRQLEQEHGIEAIVVTITSIQDYPVNQITIEAFATNLFNTWGIGDSRTNKGVLILVAIADRKVRIELGRGYGSQYNAAMQAVINEHMLPAFRQDDYSRGVHQGTRAMIAKLTGSWPAEPARVDFGRLFVPLLLVGGIGGVASLGLLGFGVHQYLQARRWRCPNCQTVMVPLPEADAANYLDAGQKKERQLQTMGYEVRRCPTCGQHKVRGYPLRRASFEKCPQCQYLTVQVASFVHEAATYHSTGLERVDQICQHCNYTRSYTNQIPMLVASTSYDNSSSSSSSSDSGGSSAGDGASGSW